VSFDCCWPTTAIFLCVLKCFFIIISLCILLIVLLSFIYQTVLDKEAQMEKEKDKIIGCIRSIATTCTEIEGILELGNENKLVSESEGLITKLRYSLFLIQVLKVNIQYMCHVI
jgi:hypothetical protein